MFEDCLRVGPYVFDADGDMCAQITLNDYTIWLSPEEEHNYDFTGRIVILE